MTGSAKGSTELDILIVGAGFAGLYALYYFRELGYSVIVLESGGGVGGTWYWNRYPGARVDFQSAEYSYSFSEELQQEWTWSERYAAQPELLKYFEYVADKFDLRRSIRFNSNVAQMTFDESSERWSVGTGTGESYSTKFCIMATGLLSAPKQPDIEGVDSFRGSRYFTSRWPHEPVDFTGQRVGVIGTGSTGIQVIPHIAKQAKHLTVFQRSPNYANPACNAPLSEEFDAYVKKNYARLREVERNSILGVVVMGDEISDGQVNPQSALEVSEEERRRKFEYCWNVANFSFYSCYSDVLTNLDANKLVADFVADKIRKKVRDPVLAEMLIPKDHPIMTKRLCAEIDYFETYNRDNVSLVDIKANPIEEITAKGVRVNGTEHELDSLVFATGFDAMTGAITNVNIRGRGGRRIKEDWAKSGPRTYLGLMSNGFPNLFFVNGPTSPVAVFHPIQLSEYQTRWIEKCIRHMTDNNLSVIEPKPESEDRWLSHSTEVANATLFPLADSWYMGANIPGKPRVIQSYLGGFVRYRPLCEAETENAYRGFDMQFGSFPPS